MIFQAFLEISPNSSEIAKEVVMQLQPQLMASNMPIYASVNPRQPQEVGLSGKLALLHDAIFDRLNMIA